MICLVAMILPTGCGKSQSTSGSSGTSVATNEKYEIDLYYPDSSQVYVAGNTIMYTVGDILKEKGESCHSFVTITYNEFGKITKKVVENMELSVHSVTTYAYDDEQHMIEKTSLSGLGDDTINPIYRFMDGMRYNYEYEGDKIISKTLDIVTSSAEDQVVVDSANKDIEFPLEYNKEGQITSGGTIEYTYNDEGYLQSAEAYRMADNDQRYLSEKTIYDETCKNIADVDESRVSTEYYNESGEVTQKWERDPNHAVFYMQNGKITPKEEGVAQVAASMSIRSSYSSATGELVPDLYKWYDEDGKEILLTNYQLDSEIPSIYDVGMASYDEKGRCIRRWDEYEYKDFVYDENDNLMQMIEYGKVFDPWRRHEYEYDQNNNVVTEREIYLKDDDITRQGRLILMEYDDHNQMTKKTTYSIINWSNSNIDPSTLPIDELYEYTYEYDSDGNMISKSSTLKISGAQTMYSDSIITTYTYDKKGRQVKAETKSENQESPSKITEWIYFD